MHLLPRLVNCMMRCEHVYEMYLTISDQVSILQEAIAFSPAAATSCYFLPFLPCSSCHFCFCCLFCLSCARPYKPLAISYLWLTTKRNMAAAGVSLLCHTILQESAIDHLPKHSTQSENYMCHFVIWSLQVYHAHYMQASTVKGVSTAYC